MEPPKLCMEPPQAVEHHMLRYCEAVPLTESQQSALYDACDKYSVDAAIALALIQTESNFQTDAESCAGCYGLCQLNRVYFPGDLTPEENIENGIRYLSQNLAKYGDYAAALTAYNVGHDNGTRNYANVVLSRANAWALALSAEGVCVYRV